MKKTIIAIGIAAFAFAACNKENVAPVAPRQEGIDASKVVFNFTVKNGEETKAVKTGWESGDKIFIFFNNVTTAYVTVTRGASDWDTPVLNGSATLTASGSLTAVYLPFGSNLTPSYSGSAWTFSETQYTYYMAAKNVSYTISNTANVATLTATLTMQNPDGFVHFFVKDAEATNGGATLATDAVIPTGITSISSTGAITETTDKKAGNAMPGYKYTKGDETGYSFSGKLVDSDSTEDGYQYEDVVNHVDLTRSYYFIKIKGETRQDYFVTGKTIGSHSAIRLPDEGDSKWITVGSDAPYVNLGGDCTWATCNVGATVPEEVGTKQYYDDAFDSHAPTEDQLDWINNNCTWIWMTVNGQPGMVVKSNSTVGFVFLPADLGNSGLYWSSTPYEDDYEDGYAWVLTFDFGGSHDVFNNDDDDDYLCVRPVQK